MAKFHITPDGPFLCFASLRECKYGGELSHYNGRDMAQAGYERILTEELGTFPKIQKIDILSENKISCKTIKTAQKLSQALLKVKTVRFHNSADGAEDDDYLTLADLSSPENAGNNCFASVLSVAEFLKSNNFENVSRKEIVFEDQSVHWGTEINGFILDYSFRQFDAESEFPLVMEYEEWNRQVRAVAVKNFGLETIESNNYSV